MTTPRPWPEGTYPPSSATWLDWFLEQDRDDQLMLAAAILASQETAARCWDLDHDSISEHLTQLERRMAELAARDLHADVVMWRSRAHQWRARAYRYHAAYRSARRSRRMWRLRAELAISGAAQMATEDQP